MKTVSVRKRFFFLHILILMHIDLCIDIIHVCRHIDPVFRTPKAFSSPFPFRSRCIIIGNTIRPNKPHTSNIYRYTWLRYNNNIFHSIQTIDLLANDQKKICKTIRYYNKIAHSHYSSHDNFSLRKNNVLYFEKSGMR